MLQNKVLLGFVIIVMMGTGCERPARENGPLSAADQVAITALGSTMDRAALAGDWGAMLALMTDDVLWIVPNGPNVQGQAACRAWVESAGMTVTEHTIDFLEIDGRGDVAYARGPYTESMTVAGFEGSFDDAGDVLAILRRQADGSWLIAIWMWNSRLPAEG